MKEKVLENLKTASRTEIIGYNFYITASNTVEDKHGKTVFRHLAKEELEHIVALTAISNALDVQGKWLTYDAAVATGGSGKGGAPIFMEENELTKRLKQKKKKKIFLFFYLVLKKKKKKKKKRFFKKKIFNMKRNPLKLLRWE